MLHQFELEELTFFGTKKAYKIVFLEKISDVKNTKSKE